MRWGGSEAVLLTLICVAALPASAAVNVEFYDTEASTNGYAPFSKAQYYAQQELDSISPATAQASGDWSGTNAGGSTSTWHWAGTSHLSTTTSFDMRGLTVTADGSFSFGIDTTSDFVDPRGTGGVFTPGGAADYRCDFELDTPATYAVSTQLNQYSVVQLGSFDGTIWFHRSNTSLTAALFQQTGTIPAGRYELLANSSLAVGSLPNGVNTYIATGSFSNYSFTLQTPEPNVGCAALVIVVSAVALKRRNPGSRRQPGGWG